MRIQDHSCLGNGEQVYAYWPGQTAPWSQQIRHIGPNHLKFMQRWGSWSNSRFAIGRPLARREGSSPFAAVKKLLSARSLRIVMQFWPPPATRVIVVPIHDITVDLQMCGVVLYAWRWMVQPKLNCSCVDIIGYAFDCIHRVPVFL